MSSLMPFKDDSPIGPRCTWCALEPASMRCQDCEPGSNMYCVPCANGVHMREKYRDHAMFFMNPEESRPHVPQPMMGIPPPSAYVPTYYHNSLEAANTPVYYGAPEVINPGGYIPLAATANLYPSLEQPYGNLQPQQQQQPQQHLYQQRPTPRQQEIERRVRSDLSESTPLVPKDKAQTSTPPSHPALVFLLVLVLIGAIIGKVFFESYVVLDTSGALYQRSMIDYVVTMNSPLLYVFVAVVMFVFGLIYLIFVRSIRDFVACLWRPSLLLPPIFLSASVCLTWWACASDGDYPGYVCGGPYAVFRYPMQLLVLAVFSLFCERKRSSAALASLASFTLIVGYVMMFWDSSMKEKSAWASPVGPSLVNLGLLVIFPLYLGSIRFALKSYTVSQVWVAQSLWLGLICSGVYFGWHPSWTLSYKETFGQDLMIPFTAGSLIVAIFLMAHLLIASFGSALTAGFHAIYATVVGVVLVVFLNQIGFVWEILSTNGLISGSDWTWTTLNIAGTIIAGLSFVVYLPVYFTWRVKAKP